ncbi:MAG: carboxyl transferase domain-containing protein [bacterium]
MKSVSDRLKELEELIAREQSMGGDKGVAKQKEKGKLTARERMDLLFDEGTFTEMDMFVKHRCQSFGMDKVDIPAEGVITGYGKVGGRTVCAYSQDFTARGGSLGEMHAKKICKAMDLAMKLGCPLVGLNDSGGARIQEGVDALSGYGSIFFRNSLASGVIPQISAIMGPTAGGAVYSPAMTDFVFMVKETSYMFITGPQVIKAVTGEEISSEDLGGAVSHCQKSGVAHFAAENDEDCLNRIRYLLSYFPGNNLEDPPWADTGDDPAREIPELDSIVPDEARRGYDMKDVIGHIVDSGTFMEVHSLYALNMIVGFARLAGHTIGIIANQPNYLGGSLDVNASDKASRFIRFCDAFNIPILTLQDVPGYLPGSDQEWAGIIRHGAKMLWVYSEATVPKITLITRKAYGGSYLAMCSRDLGADLVMAWPTAEIAVMGAEGASKIIFRKEINEAEDQDAKLKEKVAEYEELFNNPYVAANRGYIDMIIQPSQSRRMIVNALETLRTKRETRPPKKHGNIPL